MAPDETISDAIKENAAGPKAASGDNVSVTQHSLAEQIEADKYLASKAAAKKPARGIYWARSRPGDNL